MSGNDDTLTVQQHVVDSGLEAGYECAILDFEEIVLSKLSFEERLSIIQTLKRDIDVLHKEIQALGKRLTTTYDASISSQATIKTKLLEELKLKVDRQFKLEKMFRIFSEHSISD